MLHPSYTDLMKVVNSEIEEGEQPVVNSRYSIVLATSKRARQIIGGKKALVSSYGKKPLSVAIEELNEGQIKILPEDYVFEEEELLGVTEVGKEKEITEETEQEEILEAEETAAESEDV
ncbi:MAG: DNA-directed RNA polymerase subunit omega [Lachnospiraceae bacterium]|nr:DNA-directed RNA polymerase subunit omega [Lachnospiraceae bacterium]